MMRRPDPMRRTAVFAVAGAAAFVLAFGVGGSPASAHAVPVSFEPADGSQVDEPPSEIVASFTEPPELTLSSIEVLDASGTTYETGELAVAPGDNTSVVLPVEPLPDGAYTVSWRVVSQVDGHPTAGAFTFGVGVPAEAAAEAGDFEAPGLSWLETAGRWLLFGGLVPLVGLAIVVPYAFGAFRAPHRWLAALSWVTATVGLVLLAVAQHRAAGASFDVFRDTVQGRALLWRALGLAGAGTGLLLLPAADRFLRQVAIGLVGLGAAGTALAHVAAGHAAATGTPWLDVGSQWVHVVAIGIWIGGLAALVVALRGLAPEERGPAARRFSLLAAVGLAAVVATGTLRTISELDRFGSLFSTGWGRGVLAKIVGLAVLAALGAVNRYRHVPTAASSPSPLVRVGRGELLVSVPVLAAAAVVASLSPPSPTTAAAGSVGVAVAGADVATSVRAELTATPGTPGENEVSVHIADYDTEEPFAGADVSLRFAFADDPGVGESELTLEESDAGTYVGQGSNLSLAGTWQVTAVVERGVDAVEVRFDELPIEADDGAAAANGDAGDPEVSSLDIDGLTVYEVELPDGERLQIFFDPDEPGNARVHFTFFDDAGAELPVEAVEPTAAPPDGGDVDLAFTQLTPGHGLADFPDFPVEEGPWEFLVEAETADGEPLSVRVPITLGG